MGTLKLNKKIANQAQQESFTESTTTQHNKSSKTSVIADEKIEAVELCEFAKQDEGFVEELKDLRSPNETVYRRNDRTCRKIITYAPTRYRDTNGELKEISNHLIDNGTEIVNEANSFKVKFNKDTHNGKVFDLQKGNKTLTLFAVGTSKTRSHACGCKCKLCSGKDDTASMTLDDGTEIQYVAMNDRVKENIIVKERQDCYEYNFTLNIGDLAIEEGDSNNLLLKDKETGETEFIIPSPYMYDASGKRSSKVSYEIDVNGEDLAIKVMADAEFINADERAFPVIIDPIIKPYESGIECKTTYIIDRESGIKSYENDCLEIQTYDDENSYTWATLSFTLPEERNQVVERVILQVYCEEGHGNIYINDFINLDLYDFDNGGQVFTIDVTNRVYDGKGTLSFNAPTDTEAYASFATSGVNAPKIIVHYVDNTEADDTPMIKEISLTDKATGHLNLRDGDLVTKLNYMNSDDFVLPVNLSHNHKTGNSGTTFGKNWFLSINKTLKQYIPAVEADAKKITQYIYTDEFGDKYTLSEDYYYIRKNNEDFVKELIADKTKIVMDINGNMSYSGKEVYKVQNCQGYTLIPEIKNFINSDLIEQRQDEFIQLEEYVNQNKLNLDSYNFVTERDGKMYFTNLTIEQKYEKLCDANTMKSYIFLTESEATQLQGLYTSIKQLNLQKRSLNLQEKQILEQANQLNDTKTLNSKMYGTADIDNYKIPEDVSLNEDYAKASNMLSWRAAEKNLKLLKDDNSREDDQYKLLLEQKSASMIDAQISQATAQKDYIIAQAKNRLSVIIELFRTYLGKKAHYDLLIINTPTNYLMDKNGIINGFNKNGELVLICDSYGNYVGVNYDINRRITEIIDSKGTSFDFKYVNGMLRNITDSRGRIINYDYNNKSELITVTCTDGSSINIVYDGNHIKSIETSDHLQARLTFVKSTNKLEKVVNKAVSPRKGDISTLNITYLTDGISLEESGNTETYKFYPKGKLLQYKKLDSALIGQTIDYYYSVLENGRKTEYVITNTNGVQKSIIEEYDCFNLLIKRIEDWYNVSDTVKTKRETQFSYDFKSNLIGELTIEYTDKSGIITDRKYVTTYSYNAMDKLILTESYIKDEELLSGKNYEEKVYDDDGRCIKTIKWNSLDSSSKFYEECERLENGQISVAKDEIGDNSEEYEYVSGTNIVNTVKYSNGSTLSYGRDPNSFKITSVSQSTDEGESNNTNIVYQYGMPVKVESGNTVLEYEYDQKGRKTSVKVNGIEQITSTYKDYASESTNSASYLTQTDKIKVDNKELKVVYSKIGSYNEEDGTMNVSESKSIGEFKLFEKKYDINGNISYINYIGNISDKNANRMADSYTYDGYFNLIKVEAVLDGNEFLTENYTHDEYGDCIRKSYTGAVTQAYSYTYKDNAARDLDYILFEDTTNESTYKFKPLTDVNGRNTGKEIYSGENKIAAEYITYRKVGDHATNMPATVWFGSGEKIADSIKYKYDKCGNICEITENGHIVAKYTYDSLNRIIREDNKVVGTTIYAYDQNGNITERCEYDYTLKSGEELEELDCTHFSYDYEGDKLVNYNGEEFIYNDLGCPTTYRGKTLTWQYGKLLAKVSHLTKETTFTYDGLGRRTSKNNITFTYDNDGRLIKQSNGLEFVYDDKGVVGILYEEEIVTEGGTTEIIKSPYFYRKDAQGNIIAILDNTGKVVVKYFYDCWGNNIAVAETGEEDKSGIGFLNPFRYRGYYYDTETELYYLQTRYYDPEIGRFISQDILEYADPETINGLNLYAYCLNNPIRYIDPNGTNAADELRTIKTYALFVLKAGLGFISGLSKTTIGLGSNAKSIASMFGRFGGILSKISTALNYALIAISNIIDGVYSKKPAFNIVTDIAFDFTAVALGTYIGAAIGSIIPGPGTIIGGIIGGVLGGAYMFVSSTPIVKDLKDSFFDGIATIATDIWNLGKDLFNSLNSASERFLNWLDGLFRWW